MADPGTIFSILGTVIGAVGSFSQGKSESSSAKYNAAIAQQQATRERQNAELEARNFRRRQNALLATARVRRAGSGVNPSTGTSLLTDADFVKEIALGAETIRNQGAVSATRLEQQASIYRRSAKNSSTAGYMRAGTTLLSGFASIDWGGKGNY